MLSEFIGSDERWMMFRKYSTVQARLLLEKQDEVRMLEYELDDLDHADLLTEPQRLCSRRRRDEVDAKARRELMERLEKAFREYASLLMITRKLNSLQPPLSYEWKSVSNFMDNVKPVVRREAEWIENRSDLVTLRASSGQGRLAAWFELLLNRAHLTVRTSGILRKVTPAKSDPVTMHSWLESMYTTRQRLGFLVSASSSMALLIITPVMFAIPIYLLSVVGHDLGTSIGILIAFMLAFTVIIYGWTQADLVNTLTAASA